MLKRNALYVSIAVIASYWIYNLIGLETERNLPGNFSDFVLLIVRNKVIILVIIFALLKFQGDGLKTVGLNSQDLSKQLLRGLLYGIIMFVVINVVLTSVLNSIFPRPQAGPGVMAFLKDPSNLIAWLLLGIFGGGFVEELQRVFVLTRFEQAFGKVGLLIALIVTSTVFGLGHLYQGTGSAISTGMGGFCFGLIYLQRRSATEAMVAHAFSDVLAILAGMFLAGS